MSIGVILKKDANNSMNSDWETARRFALRHSPAGYAERWQSDERLGKK
ncbi:hypothetical protein JCM14469_26840 [Desulfatiferula olefinivorans]